MTVTAIDLHDFVAQLRSSVPYVHPAGRVTLDAWFDEMHKAANHGDTDHLARLVRFRVKGFNSLSGIPTCRT